MFLHQRFIPGLAIASYIVGDEKSRRAAVIDPTRDVDAYIAIAEREKLRITDILETHVHADFISGARELKTRLGDKPRIHASAEGGPEWTPSYADHPVRDGDELSLGDLRLKAIHTPGHTPEHISWALYDNTRSDDQPWVLFTGDLIFVGDVGRPDLLGAEAQKQLAHQLYGTLFNRVPELPDFTEIMPAHGEGSLCGKAIGSRRSSTLGYERRFNASMQQQPEAAWIDALMSDMPPAPPYFRRMKQVNAQGPKVFGDALPGRRALSSHELHGMIDDDLIILDARSKQAFAAAHIPNAINIPLSDNLAYWAGWVLPYDKPIVLVLDDDNDRDTVVTHLIRIGFDDIVGYLAGGIEAWQNAGLPLARLDVLTVHELNERLRQGDGHRPFVLDVRTDREWNAGHIEGAAHIHAGLLSQRMDTLPDNRPIAIVCGTGFRASIAASLLKRHGHHHVTNVMGGMSAWQAAKLPTVRG